MDLKKEMIRVMCKNAKLAKNTKKYSEYSKKADTINLHYADDSCSSRNNESKTGTENFYCQPKSYYQDWLQAVSIRDSKSPKSPKPVVKRLKNSAKTVDLKKWNPSSPRPLSPFNVDQVVVPSFFRVVSPPPKISQEVVPEVVPVIVPEIVELVEKMSMSSPVEICDVFFGKDIFSASPFGFSELVDILNQVLAEN